MQTSTTAVENNWKKNQRWIIKVGSTKDTMEQLTNISIFIKRESSVVVFLVDKSTLLVHTHHTLISLVFYKTLPLTKLLRLSSTGATVIHKRGGRVIYKVATGAVTYNSLRQCSSHTKEGW